MLSISRTGFRTPVTLAGRGAGGWEESQVGLSPSEFLPPPRGDGLGWGRVSIMAADIRLAREEDTAPMSSIYAPIVRESAISFELEPPSEDEFRHRVRNGLEETPWLVCESGKDILGYAYAGKYRSRPAYQWSVEITVYVNASYRRRGVGRALYTSLFECLPLQGYHNPYAAIALPNPASVELHEGLGFKHAGIYQSVGHKHDKWQDVGWWQLTLREHGPTPAPPRRLRDFLNTPEWERALREGLELLRTQT